MRFILTLIPIISIFSSIQALPFSTDEQALVPRNSDNRAIPGSNKLGTKIGVSWPITSRKLTPNDNNADLIARAAEDVVSMDFKALTNGFKGAARIESLPEQN
ncbi:BgTH12-00510 [Blumeria graminis f. sp. triticale]|uniref:BgtAcSP-30282 n=3 Tax=Blumeria graminis TaxID=34373 RepID=A0A9X9QF65_BLUGR|nr:hypothetical protein BGT96224_AcSP30282 [Blumeria graminis f. sp. tritici 96224]CAD6505011.1 BgTH12-00510 [Blumeria graminis f. sp. triticale]VDB93023.1 BgtAcSP-30282 [Blumeria graminis f. sp. tritici]